MDVNPNLSDKARYDYALVLRATKEKDEKAYAELDAALPRLHLSHDQ
jgi:hypothetical protein